MLRAPIALALAGFALAACGQDRYDATPKAALISDDCPAEKAKVATLDALIAGRIDTAETVETAAVVSMPLSLATGGLAGVAVGLGSAVVNYDTTALREDRAVWRAVAKARGC